MSDQLVAWHERWSSKGFTVVHVEEGRATALDTLREHLAQVNWPFPVLHDGAGRTADAFGVRAYPTGYVIDRRGKVVWEGVPLSPKSRAAIEAAVEKAL